MIKEHVLARVAQDNNVHTPEVMVSHETGMCVGVGSVCGLWCVPCVLSDCSFSVFLSR
jgi:hypothetical protein